MKADILLNAFAIIRHDTLDGILWAEVACKDYDNYSILPQVIRFQDKYLIRMSWNSDIGRAAYKESNDFALYGKR